MHEASLVAGLLNIIKDEAHKHKVEHVISVRVGLGLLACIEPVTLTACFELFAENTVADGATLHIEITPLICICGDCMYTFTLTKRQFICPHCQGKNIDFSGGHGCTILAIEAKKK